MKRIPSAANLSRFGDLQDSLPLEDNVSYPISSAMIKTMLGAEPDLESARNGIEKKALE